MQSQPKLTKVTRLDSIPIGEWTEEGFLKDMPIVTSVGIFDYRNPDGTTHKELRLPEYVFEPESLASYKGKPVIITHAAKMVTSENAPDEVIGTILSDGIRDGDNVRAEIIIHDTDAMAKSGLKELSLGYNLTLEHSPGEWNGQHYDYIQTEIRINHLALVDKARAGEKARLNIDSKDEPETPAEQGGKQAMAEKKSPKKPVMNADEMKQAISAFEKRRQSRLDGEEEPSAIEEKVTVGETNSDENPVSSNGGEEKAEAPKEVTLTEKIQQIKDRRDKRDAFGDPEDIDTAKAHIAESDGDISALLELIAKLEASKDFAEAKLGGLDQKFGADGNADCDTMGEGKPMNTDAKDVDIDAIISERLALARIGDTLNLDGIEQLKPIEAKKKIITAIKPSIRLDGKDPAYVNAAFEIAVAEHKSVKDTEFQRKQIFNSDRRDVPSQKSGASSARESMIERYQGGKE